MDPRSWTAVFYPIFIVETEAQLRVAGDVSPKPKIQGNNVTVAGSVEATWILRSVKDGAMIPFVPPPPSMTEGILRYNDKPLDVGAIMRQELIRPEPFEGLDAEPGPPPLAGVDVTLLDALFLLPLLRSLFTRKSQVDRPKL